MDRKCKRDLRDLNSRVWAGEKDVFEVNTSLDSSLKKNTAFIKRLRTGIAPSALATFLAEIKTLSLQKYLSEVISATAEGLSKLKTAAEITTGVEVTSALHQRFGPADFTKQLGWLLGRGLSAPDKAQVKQWSQDVREREEKERLTRHRILLKIVTEFWLVGILRSLEDVEKPDDFSSKGKDAAGPAKSMPNGVKLDLDHDAEPFPLEVLKELLGHDREHTNLPLAVLFVKSFGWEILGIKPAGGEGKKTVLANGVTTDYIKDSYEDGSGNESTNSGAATDDESLANPALQERFKNVLARYTEDVKKQVIRDQKSLNAQSRRNQEAYVKSGEIFEDRQANFEKQTKAQEKLIASTQVLCEALGEEMPDLAEKEASDSTIIGSIGLVKAGEYLRGQGEGAGIWEDEDERRFYENLVDLKGRVPSVLLEEGKKKKGDGDEPVPLRPTSSTTSVVKADAEKETPALAEERPGSADDKSTSIANKTVGAQVDALLNKLPELQTKDSIDQVALDFCFLNSKASRNRLIKTVQEVPKGRTDLLPVYSRLVATLGQYMPDITQGLISYLDDEFRSLQRRKSKDFLGQVRMLNIRYLAELTKFAVVPDHVIFHCFKVAIDDMSRMNIEIIANLLENCGRYLYRNPETSARMTSFLETLGRKKSAQHLGQQERMLIENAMYYVDPPQRAAIQQKERTPMDLFVRQLIYLDMTKRNYTKILKTVRKLHWEEPEVVSILEKVFSKPGKVKFSNIHLLAVLLSALYRYHQDFTIGVIDNVLEQVTLGLEQNDFKSNQRRVSEAKYLGELYNYKMVDSTVIFDTMYRIVTFGHEGGTPAPGKINPLDMPDDFFRIRLVCTVLDTCGICFDRGSSRKKLDFFLTFFQYYVLIKDSLPMDIDFILQDTYALVRPQWKLVTDLAEASRIFSDAVTANYKQSAVEKIPEVDEEGESSASDEALEEGDAPDIHDAESSSDEVEANGEEEAAAAPAESDSEEEQIFVTREEQLDPEAEADFDKEFERMMAESLDSRKFERKAVFDVPLPVRRIQREVAPVVDDEEGEPAPPPPPSTTMAFALMTKKGNRQQTRTIELPSDSHFAISMKSQQAAEREEQQRIKSLVLNYDMHDENDHDGEPCPHGLDLRQSETPWMMENPNTKGLPLGSERYSASHTRSEGGSRRNQQRARKLQLNDLDWHSWSTIFPSENLSQNSVLIGPLMATTGLEYAVSSKVASYPQEMLKSMYESNPTSLPESGIVPQRTPINEARGPVRRRMAAGGSAGLPEARSRDNLSNEEFVDHLDGVLS